MNRIERLFANQTKPVLTVYTTAGYPALDDTLPILQALQDAGVDMVEIGVPFSDPLADGPTIQLSSEQALRNGMSVQLLFDQLANMRPHIHIPVLLMGYLNPVMAYGVEAFVERCAQVGIDGLVLPDLPFDLYQSQYKELFERHGLANVLLITPQTSPERVRQIDAAGSGFLYMVSTAATTGARSGISDEQLAYFERIEQMHLRTPRLIGFGIADADSFGTASRYAHGAIVGSAFIKSLQTPNPANGVAAFVASLR